MVKLSCEDMTCRPAPRVCHEWHYRGEGGGVPGQGAEGGKPAARSGRVRDQHRAASVGVRSRHGGTGRAVTRGREASGVVSGRETASGSAFGVCPWLQEQTVSQGFVEHNSVPPHDV